MFHMLLPWGSPLTPGDRESPDLKCQVVSVTSVDWPEVQTYFGNKVLLIRAGQDVGLGSAQFTLGEMGIHLVSIKVSIIGLAVSIVEP